MPDWLAAVAETQSAVDSGDPLRALHALTIRQGLLDEAVREQVSLARLQGLTWNAIGPALGMSRQAAWERFHVRGSGATSDPALPG